MARSGSTTGDVRMIGLMYLGAAVLYLSLMFFVVRWAWRKGRADGGSRIKASGFATLGFLAVYLPLFWNWIPVVLTHRSLCSKDAGFKAYVTPDQWGAQNRDQFSRLVGLDLEKVIDSKSSSTNAFRYEFFGGLLAEERTTEVFRRYGMEFRRSERKTIDERTHTILTRRINYSVGEREDLRIWMTFQSCFPPDVTQPSDQRNSFIEKLKEQIK